MIQHVSNTIIILIKKTTAYVADTTNEIESLFLISNFLENLNAYFIMRIHFQHTFYNIIRSTLLNTHTDTHTSYSFPSFSP